MQANRSGVVGNSAPTAVRPSLLRGWVVLSVAFFLVFQCTHITAPPNGYHEWREALTASVSLGYYQESMSFFEPRVHFRGASPGITGMEFPIVSYLIAIVYLVTGESHAVARLLILMCTGGALWFLYQLTREWFDQQVATCAAFALMLAPLFLFYASKILPDSYVVLPLMLAVWFYWRWYSRRRVSDWLLAALALALAGGIKPPCLALYLPLLYLTMTGQGSKWRELWRFSLFAVVTIIPVIAWIAYSRSLAHQYHAEAFSLNLTFPQIWAAITSGLFFKMNLLQRPWELWIGYAMVLPFVIGFVRAQKSVPGRFLLLWALGHYLGLVLIASHSTEHDYDGTLIVLPIAAITGLGLHWLISRSPRLRYLAIILIIAAPCVAFLRLHHRYTDPPFAQIRQEAAAVIGFEERVIVEDWSPIIRLYQLNRFGWAMRAGTSSEYVKQAVDNGAVWFVLEKPLAQQRLDLSPYVADTTPIPIGPLYAYRIAGR